MTKSESKPSIQCNKCRKRIKYDRYYGYSHYCSGRVKDIYRAARKRLRSVNSLQNRDAQIFGMYDIADDLNSASVMYNPETDKRIRKEIEMNNRKREQVERLVRSIDRVEKRILYFERLKRNDDYDVLIRDNTNNTEPEVVENGHEIINQIIYGYRQHLEKYNKDLDELLAPETTESEQYVPPKDKRWFWGKEG